MSDELVVLDGSTFLVSERSGDVVDGGTAAGSSYADTRHLSVWQVLIDGSPVTPLTSRNIDYYSALVVGVADGGRVGENPTMTIQRDRIVSDGIHEDISVENHADTARRVAVELRYAADFADLFEVKAERICERAVTCSVDGTVVILAYEHDGFRARHQAGVHGRRRDRHRGRPLRPRAATPTNAGSLCIRRLRASIWPRTSKRAACRPRRFRPTRHHCRCRSTARGVDQRGASWKTPTSNGTAHTYRRSLLDLAALRFMPLAGDESSLPAAGLPWFMAVLGRDSVPSRPTHGISRSSRGLAAATLQVLARTQATEDDPFRDAEPGKIMHELRRGELTVSSASCLTRPTTGATT